MDDLFADVPVPVHGIRTGIGGWTYPEWRDNFYPKGLVQKRELEYASRRLTAIEINGTFYGAQKPATYAKWGSETPAGFVFSLKAPRHIVGARALAGTAKQIAGFVDGGIAELGDHLGPLLWQFAPQRRFDADDVEAFLDLLPDAVDGLPLRHAIEVRHPSFQSEAWLRLARARGVATVFTDSTDYPSFADITGGFVYARLMASRETSITGYPGLQLDAWVKRALQWAAGEAPTDLPYAGARDAAPVTPRDTFVFFISAAKARNPAAAMALQQRLEDIA
ncbi:DUF72 domain-containing protein [Luteimonas sp. 3794]|uniref:DUF72 domain-containing protein n=1 Tax=Luteimonas sp. 3794 TaxID=2817730 RepID=UPI00286365D6|nr:DUF72 domain-containing protein [Luteimonas sp. 3794]MDR6990429.1 uncharacterized protein YecE (DUF72 family) [Luteimonas sp. 3794]